MCPKWVAPNLLTLVGFICCVGHFLLLTVYDYDFSAGTAPPDIRQPSIHSFVCIHNLLCISKIMMDPVPDPNFYREIQFVFSLKFKNYN